MLQGLCSSCFHLTCSACKAALWHAGCAASSCSHAWQIALGIAAITSCSEYLACELLAMWTLHLASVAAMLSEHHLNANAPPQAPQMTDMRSAAMQMIQCQRVHGPPRPATLTCQPTNGLPWLP